MPEHPLTPKPNPTGTQLIRLADIPNQTRIKAARTLMAQAKDTNEYIQYFQLAYNPGNKGGRICP